MLRLVKCDLEIINKIPSLMSYLYKMFAEEEFLMYALIKDDKLDFIARKINGNDCFYIKYDEDLEIIPFLLNDNNEIYKIELKDYYVLFDNDAVIFENRENNNQEILEFLKMNGQDHDGYNGLVSYRQYNPKNDTYCDIQYQHMYSDSVDGINKIYEYHLRKINGVFIDEQVSKFNVVKKGLVSNKHKYYHRDEYNNQERYYKVFYIDKNGNYKLSYILGESYSEDDLKDMIKSYCFSYKVPDTILSIYNQENEIINDINDAINYINQIHKNNCEEMYMRLQIKKD